MTKHRVIGIVFIFLSSSFYLAAQKMGVDPQQPPLAALHSHGTENRSISGTVRDTNNNPLTDVRVELTDWNGSVVNATYTNRAGGFEFSSVSEGRYMIVATSGIQQVSEHVEAGAFSNMVSLRLPANKPEDGLGGNSVSVAQYRVPAKARDEFNKAHEGLEKGKLEDANRHLAKALEIDPDYADALTLRAILELDKKQPEAAIADLDKAIKADANCALAYMVMGSALNMESKYDEAIHALERGETLAPNYWQAHFEIGKSYIGKGDYQAALTQLDRAQSMANAEYPPIYFLRARVLLAMKQYSEAMTALQAYLQKEPQGANSEKAREMLEQTQALVAKAK